MRWNRLFFIGVVVLLLGIHFRIVDTFVLNEKASQFVRERGYVQASPAVTKTQVVSLDPIEDWWQEPAKSPSISSLASITPPDWLGWSLISVGSVLILTCPCFRS